MGDEKYVAENFEYQHRSNKILDNLREKNKELSDKVIELEKELARIKKIIQKSKQVCECGGELSLDKELNCTPKMNTYNCDKCHQNVTIKENE